MNGLLQGIVLCVGEALIALAPEDGWSLETATALEVCEAGAEVSVAVHLARLGVPVRFAGLVGDDPWGGRIRNALAREGVDVSTLGIHRSAPTGMYLKNVGPNGTTVHYYRRGSAASTMDHVPPAAHAGVGHIHLSGITPALAPQCARMIRQELTHKEGRSVSFDVNYRRALWPPDQAAPVLGELARQADLVFVGLDEAAALWGCQTAEQVRALLPEPAEIVVKDAGRAATAFTSRNGPVRVAALHVKVVEPIGAGDAFAAGYLAALRQGGDRARALRVAHAMAAMVLTSYSDHGRAVDLELLASASDGRGWPHVRT